MTSLWLRDEFAKPWGGPNGPGIWCGNFWDVIVGIHMWDMTTREVIDPEFGVGYETTVPIGVWEESGHVAVMEA